MTTSRDNEYHDPRALGSLSDALRIWQSLEAEQQDRRPHHLVFRFSCPSEARANRVASFLRRRLACADASVTPGPAHATWHVHGSTDQEIQSLPNLEHLSAWLRGAAMKYQVRLIDFTLAQRAA